LVSLFCELLFIFAPVDFTCHSAQVISPQDLELLHQYLMVWYDLQDFEDYLHFLALYRNTRAIEAQNARHQYTKLSEACASVENARLMVIKRLQDRHSTPQ